MLVAGGRRLNAARKLKIRVRAIVKALTDADAIVAQGVKNAGRDDLSYVERAVFALTLQKANVDRSTIMSALSVETFSLSRMISVAFSDDRKIFKAIGPAPTVGRTRWRDLAERLLEPGMADRAKAPVKRHDFKTRSSDGQFSMVLEAVARPGSKPFSRPITVDGSERKIGTVTFSGKSAVFSLGSASPAGFADFLASRLESLTPSSTIRRRQRLRPADVQRLVRACDP